MALIPPAYNSEPSRSGTDQESDSNVKTRRTRKRTEMELESNFNKFRIDISEHITNLFSSFKKDQDEKFSIIQTNIQALSEEIKALKTTNTDTMITLNSLSEKHEALLIKNQKLQVLSELHDTQINQLEEDMMSIQSAMSEYKLEIRNIPLSEKEGKKEIIEFILSVCEKINVEISTSDIREVRRLQGKPETSKPILLELSNTDIKSRILKGLKKYNEINKEKLHTGNLGLGGPNKSIYISEYLTKSTKTLFFRAREFAKKFRYTYCWAAYGQIYLRKEDGAKRIRVVSEKILRKLGQEHTSAPLY